MWFLHVVCLVFYLYSEKRLSIVTRTSNWALELQLSSWLWLISTNKNVKIWHLIRYVPAACKTEGVAHLAF